jgi:hypothetical protein
MPFILVAARSEKKERTSEARKSRFTTNLNGRIVLQHHLAQGAEMSPTGPETHNIAGPYKPCYIRQGPNSVRLLDRNEACVMDFCF